MKNKIEYKEDFSKENPSLHLIYVKQAVRHLILVENAIKSFSIGNCHMIGFIEVLKRQKINLINENKAYTDAQEIIDIINNEEII